MKYVKLTMCNECVSFDYLLSSDELSEIAYNIVDLIYEDFNNILDIYGVSEDELEDFDEDIYESYTDANNKLEEFNLKSKTDDFSEKDFDFSTYEENNVYKISKVYDGKDGLQKLIEDDNIWFGDDVNLDVDEEKLAKLVDEYLKNKTDRM